MSESLAVGFLFAMKTLPESMMIAAVTLIIPVPQGSVCRGNPEPVAFGLASRGSFSVDVKGMRYLQPTRKRRFVKDCGQYHS
jgi:hypothetical protein